MSHEKPTPGQFCWYDLATTDPAGARAFYGGLFGWTTRDDATPQGVYSHIQTGETPLGGMYEINAEMKAHGVPPHWMPYVAVDDVAASMERAKGLGGAVLMGPYDAGDAGTLAVLRDPTGAAVALWQSRKPGGEGSPGPAHGSVCWNELVTRDVEAARAFYCGLFGWQVHEQPMPTGTYTMFVQGDARVGGMLQMTEQWGAAPPHWMSYVSVADCDATAARARELGGEVVMPPTEIPQVGFFSAIRDPQGAMISTMQLEMPG